MKKILSFVFALSLVCMIASCGGKSTSTVATSSLTADTIVETVDTTCVNNTVLVVDSVATVDCTCPECAE